MVGDDNASTTNVSGALGIGNGHDAFEAELAVPQAYHLSHIVPVHGRVEHLSEIAADRERATAHVDVLVKLWQLEPLVCDVVDSPPGFDGKLQHTGER